MRRPLFRQGQIRGHRTHTANPERAYWASILDRSSIGATHPTFDDAPTGTSHSPHRWASTGGQGDERDDNPMRT